MLPQDSVSELSVPPVLYKYAFWDESDDIHAFRHKILTVPQIYFTAPSMFNDPFDCQLSLGLESKSNREIIDYLKTRSYADEETLERVQNWLKIDRNKWIDTINDADFLRKDSNCGLFCTSAVSTNSLLWSHYAGGHKGFSVGLNAQYLIRHLESLCNKRGFILEHFEVEYRKELPDLEPFLEDNREWFLQRFRYKASDWSYEQEYRFLLMKDLDLENPERVVQIPPECISEVILGCKLDDTTKAEIMESIEKLRQGNPRIKLLRAVKSKKRYEYELEAI